jgi:hypothetical protein
MQPDSASTTGSINIGLRMTHPARAPRGGAKTLKAFLDNA